MHELKVKRLPRVTKKRLKKESPAGSHSSSPRRIVKITHRRKPAPPAIPSEPPVKVPSKQFLARVAKRYGEIDNPGYKLVKDDWRNPTNLALDAVNGPFACALGKYKGYEPLQLMEAVIDYIRTEPPKVEPPKVKAEKKPPKGPTARQLEQSARTSPPPPAPITKPARPRKRQSGQSKEEQGDLKIVQDALHALFEDDPQLKELFCSVSLVEAKRQLRTHEAIVQLAVNLRMSLSAPRRVLNYLDTATRTLIPRYGKEHREAERLAEATAQARRESERAAAQTAAARREQQRRSELRRRQPVDAEFWRGLRRA